MMPNFNHALPHSQTLILVIVVFLTTYVANAWLVSRLLSQWPGTRLLSRRRGRLLSRRPGDVTSGSVPVPPSGGDVQDLSKLKFNPLDMNDADLAVAMTYQTCMSCLRHRIPADQVRPYQCCPSLHREDASYPKCCRNSGSELHTKS